MKILHAPFIILFLLLPLAGAAQMPAVAEKFASRDTLQVRSLYADLSLLMMLSDEELEPHTDIRAVGGAHLRYVFGRNDVDLLLRSDIESDHDRAISYDNYIALSAGIMKYDPAGEGRATFRHLYPEAVVIYQSNTYRGLAGRIQAGALLYPWTLHRPNFKLNIAVGGVYDWSWWRVNEADEIAACPPELQEKIRFINSRTRLRKNMYQLHDEFRPVVVVDARLHLNDALKLRLSTSYQQSLVSPYSREVIAAYPELGKVYPYVMSRLEVSTKINARLSFQTTLAVDYENSNLSLYASSWQYGLMFGLAFHLHGREL